MLTVATDQSFLTLQTHPQQLQLVVMTVLETLQLLQLLTGVDGDDPLVVTEGGVHAGDEAPPACQPALPAAGPPFPQPTSPGERIPDASGGRNLQDPRRGGGTTSTFT